MLVEVTLCLLGCEFIFVGRVVQSLLYDLGFLKVRDFLDLPSGRLLFERATQYDYTTVMGITTFAALLVVLGNLLADVLYALLDPRIRYG